MLTGHCACGAVRFALTGPLRQVVNCHCFRCRQWTGHFMAATNTAAGDLAFASGEGLVNWWRPAEEPSVAYGSCSVCGSGLFWKADDKPDTVSVTAGSLDGPTGLHTAGAIYTEEAADYHRLDDAIPVKPKTSPYG